MLHNFLDFDASDITSVFIGLFGALYGETFYVWVRNKMDGQHRKIKRPTASQVMGVILAAVLVWVLYSTNEIQSEIKRSSRQTLLIAEAVCEEQKLATAERTALQDLFLNALAIPKEIRDLEPNDPVRVKWGQELVTKYIGTLEQTNLRRHELAFEFEHNPPSEPRCGRPAS